VLKSPDRPNAVGVELGGAVLGAIVEVLVPREVRTDLRRGPVVDSSEPTNTSPLREQRVQFG